jgi:hypothetical protein
MNEWTNTALQGLLSHPVISRIRRNHGLEHATLHVLSQELPGRSLAGHSDAGGFWLLGEVSTEELRRAVEKARQRMLAGEENLAVHPNCGTNFVTSGLMAASAAMLAMIGAGNSRRDRLERFPLVVSLATLALLAAQPLGLLAQQHLTTSGRPGELRVREIIPTRRGKVRAHRVVTEG